MTRIDILYQFGGHLAMCFVLLVDVLANLAISLLLLVWALLSKQVGDLPSWQETVSARTGRGMLNQRVLARAFGWVIDLAYTYVIRQPHYAHLPDGRYFVHPSHCIRAFVKTRHLAYLPAAYRGPLPPSLEDCYRPDPRQRDFIVTNLNSTGAFLVLALRTSMKRPDVAANRHWLARIAIGLWAIHLPIIAFMAPASIVGQALERTGAVGFLFAFIVAVLAGIGIADSVINGAFPSRHTVCMLNQRHVGFMLLAAFLVIAGVGLLRRGSQAPSVALISFLIPAALCVLVTVLDLRLRHQERLGA